MTNLPAADQQQPAQEREDQHNHGTESEEVSVIAEAVKQHIAAIEDGAIDEEDAEALLASLYYDAGTMSSLNPTAEVCSFFSLIHACRS
jgi:hypothetical protein